MEFVLFVSANDFQKTKFITYVVICIDFSCHTHTLEDPLNVNMIGYVYLKAQNPVWTTGFYFSPSVFLWFNSNVNRALFFLFVTSI